MPVVRICSADEFAWVRYKCTDWNEELDLSWLLPARSGPGAKYYVIAAIFHIHGPTDRADTTHGHYVILVKHGDVWYMSSDAVVRPLSFDSSPGAPYAIYST